MLPVNSFVDYIKKNSLFTPEDKILLAVSGGKDSVLMAQLFKLAGFNFSIAHCNFNLRGDESQRDEAFVKLLAAILEVPFYVNHFETKSFAKEHQLSTQMAARTLRYNWFEEVRTQYKYHYIAVAHHQNDSIETLLLNLTRGTGISGMHGILPKRGYLIRPLLFLSRQQIDDLVNENHIDFVEDSSNQSDNYARNSIRLNVVPVLKELNPSLEETFVQNFIRFAETEMVLQNVIAQTRSSLCENRNGDIYISIDKINLLQPQRLLFFELLKPYHFASAVVEEILQSLTKQSGTLFYSHTHCLTIDRSEVIISPLRESAHTANRFIHSDDEAIWIGSQRMIMTHTSSTYFESNLNKLFVDSDQLIFPLVLRFWQDGDRFMPLGMQHHKKVSDFLISQKIPIPNKSKIPLLVNGNGEIIWVVGLRQDNRYKVKATTKKVVIFELLNQ
ncbi:tRNA(Ile)-lysidine synthase [Pedobacter insulae]|uniref:tRNA(Ile)-lysidine synthase n=2 Tax=Pedobacter insulae TaxID=414048 RepID=A0A1I2ZSQ2_9SPHI|nr:tRNA(Ile)-lysidine synthase [Pedobacter insulae]